jgi:tRNA(Glu) U13 pseudouridine synthase TruD
MTTPEGEPLRVEQEVFAGAGLEPEHFRGDAVGRVTGARRPLRVRPEDVELAGGVDDHGGYVTVAFTLPPGSFATVLLHELMKAGTPPLATPDAAPEAPADEVSEASAIEEE